MFSKSSQDFCSSNTIAAALHKPGEPRSICEREREGQFWLKNSPNRTKFGSREAAPSSSSSCYHARSTHFQNCAQIVVLSSLSISSSNAGRRCNRGLANQPCGLPLGCSRFALILSRENADRNNNHPRTLI